MPPKGKSRTLSDLRSTILAASDIRSQIVEVPEWGVSVEVRSMTARDRTRIMSEASKNDGVVDIGFMYVETVLTSTYDPETGLRVFEDSDRDAVMAKSASAIDRLAVLGMQLSGIDQEAQDNAKRQFPEESSEEVPV